MNNINQFDYGFVCTTFLYITGRSTGRCSCPAGLNLLALGDFSYLYLVKFLSDSHGTAVGDPDLHYFPDPDPRSIFSDRTQKFEVIQKLK